MAFAKARPLGGVSARDWVQRNDSVSTAVNGSDAASVWGNYKSPAPERGPAQSIASTADQVSDPSGAGGIIADRGQQTAAHQSPVRNLGNGSETPAITGTSDRGRNEKDDDLFGDFEESEEE